ncbi:hypothetical protein AVEN_16743-1 [Araneus ventricosus]|uniref:Transposase IS30-like HTH domain-containing protein n=1 Tax=Araneus ventricosus TaxID=182803 RepID=A0A4Y2GG94_ARAVE|nr:hypothetical protein AVEN_16743-1 [Araneus ventricosus]
MLLRRRRSHYQQLTEFERGRAVGLREGGFSFRDIAERLGRNVYTVHDYWQQWSREGQLRARRPVACIPPTPNHCRLRREWCQARAHWWTKWSLLCFLKKAGSALVPVMAVCWLEGGQVSVCNQPVCGLDTCSYGLGSNFL